MVDDDGKTLRRVDEAWYHAIDTNVVRRKLVGEHLREANLRRFCWTGAGGQEWRVQRHDSGLAAHIDDSATALSNHHRHHTLTDAKLSKEIDCHALDEFLIGDFEEWLVGAGAGIVDENVDAAQFVGDDAGMISI